MKSFYIIMLIIFSIHSLSAQKQYLVKNKNYANAKIYQKGVSVIQVKNLELTNDTLLQYSMVDNGLSSAKIQLSSTNIRYIAVKKGTYAGTYAVAGGAIGLLSALYGIVSVKNDPTLDDSGVNWAPFIFGFTAGGVAVGALIGVCIPKWKMLYIPDKSTSYSIGISPYVSSNYCGLGLRVNF